MARKILWINTDVYSSVGVKYRSIWKFKVRWFSNNYRPLRIELFTRVRWYESRRPSEMTKVALFFKKRKNYSRHKSECSFFHFLHDNTIWLHVCCWFVYVLAYSLSWMNFSIIWEDNEKKIMKIIILDGWLCVIFSFALGIESILYIKYMNFSMNKNCCINFVFYLIICITILNNTFC